MGMYYIPIYIGGEGNCNAQWWAHAAPNHVAAPFACCTQGNILRKVVMKVG